MAKTYEAMSKSAGALSENAGSLREPDFVIKSTKNAEQLNNLEQQITHFMKKNNAKVFQFTSSRGMEGVSNIVANVTWIMAEKRSFENILVIDANFNNPSIHTLFGVPSSPGIRSVLSGSSSISESIHVIKPEAIHIMPCGKGGMNISGSAGQDKFSALLVELKSEFECIIIDSPPILTSSDSLSSAIFADMTFLVIEANKTLWEVAEKSKLYLEKHGCQIGGVVLNRVKHAIPDFVYKRL